MGASYGREFMREWFDVADKNGDNKISFKEAQAILPTLEETLKELKDDSQKLISYFNSVDKNKDGYIDFEEFKVVCLDKVKKVFEKRKRHAKEDSTGF